MGGIIPKMVSEPGQPAVRDGLQHLGGAGMSPYGQLGSLQRPSENPGDDIARAIKALNEALKRGAGVGWSAILEVDADLSYGPDRPSFSQVHATITRKV